MILRLIVAEEIEEEMNKVDLHMSATKKAKASRKPVKTTSQAAKKERGRKIKVGVCIKIQQKQLYPICSTKKQRGDALLIEDQDYAF